MVAWQATGIPGKGERGRDEAFRKNPGKTSGLPARKLLVRDQQSTRGRAICRTSGCSRRNEKKRKI